MHHLDFLALRAILELFLSDDLNGESAILWILLLLRLRLLAVVAIYRHSLATWSKTKMGWLINFLHNFVDLCLTTNTNLGRNRILLEALDADHELVEIAHPRFKDVPQFKLSLLYILDWGLWASYSSLIVCHLILPSRLVLLIAKKRRVWLAEVRGVDIESSRLIIDALCVHNNDDEFDCDFAESQSEPALHPLLVLDDPQLAELYANVEIWLLCEYLCENLCLVLPQIGRATCSLSVWVCWMLMHVLLWTHLWHLLRVITVCSYSSGCYSSCSIISVFREPWLKLT